MNSSDELDFLVDWFVGERALMPDGEYRVHLESLDNPGWYLQVRLVGTEVSGEVWPMIAREPTRDGFLYTWSDGELFTGASGTLNLRESLAQFEAFVRTTRGEVAQERSVASRADELDYLMEWSAAQCDEDWEHIFGTRIKAVPGTGWSLRVDIEETGLDGVLQDVLELRVSDDDWCRSWCDGKRFEAVCGPPSLRRALTAFREFGVAAPGVG